MIEFKTKKPKYKELAIYLGVSEQAVKQYSKIKRDLMILGLWTIKEKNCDQIVTIDTNKHSKTVTKIQ